MKSMNLPSKRQLVFASAIREAISVAFVKHQIYHPALEGIIISFTYAEISSDLKNAVIYFDCLDETLSQDTLKHLQDLSPTVRKFLASTMKLRYVPTIAFAIDQKTKKQQKLYKLIDSISANNN